MNDRLVDTRNAEPLWSRMEYYLSVIYLHWLLSERSWQELKSNDIAISEKVRGSE